MKLLVSDFDDTLYFRRKGGFKEADLIAINNAKEIIYGICTGRPLSHITSKINGKVDWKFIAASSGAYIINNNNEVLYESIVDFDVLNDFVTEYRGKYRIDFQSEDKDAYTYLERGNFIEPQIFIEDLSEIKNVPVNQIGIHPTSSVQADELFKDISLKFSDRLSFYKNEKDIDVNAKGISKGKAIRVIKQHFPNDGVYVIGDNYNDIPMFEEVENSICFDYSPTEVKNRAKFIVSSLEEAIKLINND